MSQSFFQFKQFTVHHDRCAMKVGTDGVLLGAWAPVSGCQRILDVGTGTGLVALQLAQRTGKAEITGVEIDDAAASQARENVLQSPWSDRISICHTDFLHYAPSHRYDLIVSNPPYFIDALHCPDRQRNTARHAGGLNYESLFRQALTLLEPDGSLALIIPAELEPHVMEAAGANGLYRYRCLRVFSKPQKPCRRLLLQLGTDPLHPFQEEKLYINTDNEEYSVDYRALTGDFYLKM